MFRTEIFRVQHGQYKIIKMTNQYSSRTPLEYLLQNIEEDEYSGCWNWIGNMFQGGYGQFKHRKFLGKTTGINASRASWLIHNGPLDSYLFVLHKCDNRRCVNPSHLYVGTQKDNMKDCTVKQRINKGEDRPQSKLTEENVREIKDLKIRQFSYREIAKKYNVTPNAVVSIVRGITWSHVN